jgi:hypothetical protein
MIADIFKYAGEGIDSGLANGLDPKKWSGYHLI